MTGVVISRALGPNECVGSIVLRLMVLPARLVLKTILSGAASALASRTACRRLPGPASFRLVTLKVDGTVRSSSTSRPGRHVGFGRQPRRVDFLAPESQVWKEESHMATSPVTKRSAG